MGDRKKARITDSITQVDTKALGDSPATAMGKLFTATARGLADSVKPPQPTAAVKAKPAPKPARARK